GVGQVHLHRNARGHRERAALAVHAAHRQVDAVHADPVQRAAREGFGAGGDIGQTCVVGNGVHEGDSIGGLLRHVRAARHVFNRPRKPNTGNRKPASGSSARVARPSASWSYCKPTARNKVSGPCILAAPASPCCSSATWSRTAAFRAGLSLPSASMVNPCRASRFIGSGERPRSARDSSPRRLPTRQASKAILAARGLVEPLPNQTRVSNSANASASGAATLHCAAKSAGGGAISNTIAASTGAVQHATGTAPARA